jgi:hypothetical protein
MRFKHTGELRDGKLYENESNKEWAGAIEKYELSEANGSTVLDVSVDTTEGFNDFMTKTFPSALQLVKKLAEETVNT